MAECQPEPAKVSVNAGLAQTCHLARPHPCLQSGWIQPEGRGDQRGVYVKPSVEPVTAVMS